MNFCWHYNKNEKHNRYFIEWKYFNINTPELKAFFSYNIIDPEMISKFGHAFIFGRLFTGNKIIGDKIMLENNDVKLTKSLDANFSKENLIRKYHDKIIITGQSDIMEWNLEYTPILNKPQQINDVRTSKNNWEKINWQVIYPLAKVTGHISINHRLLSQVFTISDYGYIDNNWGKFIPIKCHWNWVQIFSENSEIIITFGEIATSKKKYMSFIHKNQNYIFRDEEIKIKHSAWEWDKLKKIKVPVTSIVTVTNKKIDILIKIKTNNFETLDLKTFFPLPHMYINEQSVIAEGIIKKNGGEKVNFKGYGLKEYTDRGYPIMDKIRYTVINGH